MPEIEHVILVTDHAYINGGVSKVAIDEAKGLAVTGRRVTYFAAIGPVDESLKQAGVEVVCLNQPDISEDKNRAAAMLRGLWNREVASVLTRLIEDADPDHTILHGHSFSRGLSPAFGPAFVSGKLPHVYTMHEYFLACPNGGFYDYQRQEICKRRGMGVRCLCTNCDSRHGAHKIFRVARHAILQGMGRLPRALRDIVYISQTQLEVMRPYLPKAATLHHLANPIAIDPTAGRTKAEDNDVFLYVGRLSPEKGCVDFAKAARDAGVRAVFLGKGSQEDAIRQENPNAELLGWVNTDEVTHWMSQARALVFPSLWYEGQPLVSMEALSKGLPVIVANWNAAAEQIEHEKTGLIYTEREKLTDVLKQLTPAFAKELSINAYNNREAYGNSVKDHVDSLLNIYRKTGE
ncbi:glycosyltransferase family 4 protein [Rhodopirellula sp. P2]|uniref:glycosyltransferase family 4 protein n=1 Tax=Rhodopirellula sp. P2 TaxID=2127060 RepID=UPI002367F819|nr:glycosyltransferase family 4 protein [Rhodopirellula sp. P2]WDQ17493.1 glycosyltransferase family 4 protein [Rhodopirellula sp. P2]